MLLTKVVVILTVLVVGLAYLLYRRPHPKVEDSWQAGTVDSLLHLALSLGGIAGKLGIGDGVSIQRYLVDAVLTPLGPLIGSDQVEREDTLFDGVPVRIYRPVKRGDAPLPGLVYFHGGAWIFGSIASHDGPMAYHSVEVNIVVVSVEYRMAPEHPFPVPLDDCRKATEYFISNAAKFGVNPARVAVGGDSAGGNLAAALSQQLRDTKSRFMPKAQVLIYPVLQMVDFGIPSFVETKVDLQAYGMMISAYLDLPNEYAGVIAHNRQMSPAVAKKVKPYMDIKALPNGFVPPDFKSTDPENFDKRVTGSVEELLINPYVSPLLAPDISGLPHTFVFTAGGDALRDDGALYVERLKKAGIKVSWLDLPGGFHGCLNAMRGIFKTKCGQRLNGDIVNFLKQVL